MESEKIGMIGINNRWIDVELLKRIMKNRRLSYRDLANATGFKEIAIRKAFRDEKAPTDMIVAIARSLNVETSRFSDYYSNAVVVSDIPKEIDKDSQTFAAIEFELSYLCDLTSIEVKHLWRKYCDHAMKYHRPDLGEFRMMVIKWHQSSIPGFETYLVQVEGWE